VATTNTLAYYGTELIAAGACLRGDLKRVSFSPPCKHKTRFAVTNTTAYYGMELGMAERVYCASTCGQLYEPFLWHYLRKFLRIYS
jgi:hypothetical protein